MGGSHFFGEREAVCCPGSGTLPPPGTTGQFGGRNRKMKSPTPTPEQASFPLCTRADLPLLSTLFIQMEAAGWFPTSVYVDISTLY